MHPLKWYLPFFKKSGVKSVPKKGAMDEVNNYYPINFIPALRYWNKSYESNFLHFLMITLSSEIYSLNPEGPNQQNRQ
jgi:hypothetical protein